MYLGIPRGRKYSTRFFSSLVNRELYSTSAGFSGNNNNNNFILVSMSFSAFALIGDTFQARIGIWKCWFLRRGENRSTREKPLGAEKRTKNKLTYDAGSGNRARDTLVGGERSHHCTIPAPQSETHASCNGIPRQNVKKM